TASPIGDTLPVLMALRGDIVLRNVQASRTLPIEQFIKGYRQTDCRADELVTSLRIPGIPEGTRVRSYKISRRHEMDISTVSAGFSVHLDGEERVEDIVLAYGGMAATPARAGKTEAFLHGKPWTREVVEEGMKVIDSEFQPMTDERGSGNFRMVVARNLLLKFWSETTSAPVAAWNGMGVRA
ncbi:MAG: FAD binding domain-containing protein, partial [Bacteroidetes bacterium]|nr:FAD binding domain-containing protein [Bacteroidota bacterium]